MKNIKLKKHNLFYYIAFRKLKNKIVGFCVKTIRYDIVENIYRENILFIKIFKPGLFKNKKNLLVNKIDKKKFKKYFTSINEVKYFGSELYNIVNNPNNIIFSNMNDDDILSFYKKYFPKLQLNNINFIEYEQSNDEVNTLEDIFKDNFRNELIEELNKE